MQVMSTSRSIPLMMDMMAPPVLRGWFLGLFCRRLDLGRLRRESGRSPLEFLLRGVGLGQMERKCAHGTLIQELPFSDDHDILIAPKSVGNFDPLPVRNAGMDGYRLGFALLN